MVHGQGEDPKGPGRRKVRLSRIRLGRGTAVPASDHSPALGVRSPGELSPLIDASRAPPTAPLFPGTAKSSPHRGSQRRLHSRARSQHGRPGAVAALKRHGGAPASLPGTLPASRLHALPPPPPHTHRDRLRQRWRPLAFYQVTVGQKATGRAPTRKMGEDFGLLGN